MLLALRRDDRWQPAAPGAHRRQPRERVRRRGRAALPAHLHGHGRRREPRGTGHGERAGRRAPLRLPGVLDRSPTHFRDDPPRAVRGQGQGQARAGMVGRAAGLRAARAPPWRSAFRSSAARAKSPRWPARSMTRAREPAASSRSSARPGSARPASRRSCTSAREGFERLTATAEAFTSSTPYVAWRELLRPALGLGWEDHDEVVLARLGALVDELAPELRRGCRCSPYRSTSTRRARRRSTRSRPSSAAPGCTSRRSRSCARCSRGRR